MSLRVLSESLTKVPVKEKQYIVTTARELDEKMLASYNRMKSIREQAENIQAQWKSLQEDLEGVTFARYVTNGTMREQFLKAVDDLKLEYEDAKSSYLHYKELKNKVLTEGSVETDELVYDFEDEDDRPVRIEVDSQEKSNVDDNSGVDVIAEDSVIQEITKLLDAHDKEDLLDFMFNEFVPEYGVADTHVGELIRALMHILFTYKLSGHTFYQDQGIGQCGGAAQFLMDNGYEDILNTVMSSDELDYNTEMFNVVEAVARDIVTDNSLLTKTNSTDSKTYTNSRIISNAPSFTYIVYIPYRLIEKIESREISYSEVVNYIRDKLGLSEETISEDPYNDETAIEFKGLTKNQFDSVDSLIQDDDVWSDFYNNDVTEERNIETNDIVDTDTIEDNVVTESIEATNITLTEDNDSDIEKFLELHDDYENYENNKYGFAKLYELFDSYGFSSEEDVDVCFQNLSDEDKELALQLISKK